MKRKFLLPVVIALILNTTFFINKSMSQWVSTNIPNGGNIHGLAVIGTNIFAGTYSGVFLSTNNGASWTAVNNGLTNLYVISLAVSGTFLFAGTEGGGVFLSADYGATWASIGLTIQTVKAIAVSGTNIFAGTFGGGVYRSSNYGSNWTQVNNGLANPYIYALAVSGSYLFAGANVVGVFRTSNNGANWIAVGSTSPYVYTLAALGTNLFAGTSGGIYLSTNDGSNWTAVNNGLTNLGVYALSVSGAKLFAGTYDGVFLSTNNGTTWLNKNQGFSSVPIIYSLLITNTYIFAGANQAVWRRLYSEVIGIQNISTEIPTKYSLAQNYPNPFNPVTNLEFGISDLGFVSLKVYDILGKEVATLVNERLEPGTYRVEFDAGSLTSGVYFYKLAIGDFTETKRMILMK